MKKKVMLLAVALGVTMSMAVGSPALAAEKQGIVDCMTSPIVRHGLKVVGLVTGGPVGAILTVGGFVCDVATIVTAPF